MQKKLHHMLMVVCCVFIHQVYGSYSYTPIIKRVTSTGSMQDVSGSSNQGIIHRYPCNVIPKNNLPLEEVEIDKCDLRKHLGIKSVNSKLKTSMEEYIKNYKNLPLECQIREIELACGNFVSRKSSCLAQNNLNLLFTLTGCLKPQSVELDVLQSAYDQLSTYRGAVRPSMHCVLTPIQQKIRELKMQELSADRKEV